MTSSPIPSPKRQPKDGARAWRRAWNASSPPSFPRAPWLPPESARPRTRSGEQTMKTKDFTLAFTVKQTPEQVFQAINNVPAWWSGEIEGNADKLGSEFTYKVEGVHFTRQKVTEFVYGKRIVWRVSEAKISFVKDQGEWKGTDIVFEIGKKEGKTELRFTHRGLTSAYECFTNCSNAWGLLVNGNLHRLIATGKPQPSPWVVAA